jgi:enamine deaminase RidA (YjgF/YER057c/UK114 family)
MAQIISPKDTFALPGMSAGVVANGPLIFISGQVALDSQGAIVGEGDFPAQVAQVMKNFEAVLREAGASFRDVVKIGVFLSDRQYLPIWRELRSSYFSEPFPASTLVVAQLISPLLLIEVEAIASVQS